MVQMKFHFSESYKAEKTKLLVCELFRYLSLFFNYLLMMSLVGYFSVLSVRLYNNFTLFNQHCTHWFEEVRNIKFK